MYRQISNAFKSKLKKLLKLFLFIILRLSLRMIISLIIYVGFTVLETSKLAMYTFRYDFMKKTFNDFKLLFTDTDSLCYEICDENPYEKFYAHRKYFYLSNYSKNSKYFCNDNKNLLVKMKDEHGGNAPKEFIRLRSKTYSILDTKNNEKSTHKVHNLYIKYGEFCDTLFNKNVLAYKMRGRESKNHNLITYECNKTSASCFDDI